MHIVTSVPIGLPGVQQLSAKIWKEYLGVSSEIKIATGYITEDAIIEIKKITELNAKPNFEIFIGMHVFELFTKTQYEAVRALSSALEANNRGHVYLSEKVRFHGKMYSFSTDTKCVAAAIGSSNLGSFIGTSKDLYEIDCCFQNETDCDSIKNKIDDIISTLGSPFADVTINKFNDRNKILEGEYGVTDATNILHNIKIASTNTFFVFPLKAEEKSNLNVYFGKGRVTPSGFVQPRPWYEVEIIVPQSVTSKPDYPDEGSITVCTDDGWQFECTISGTNKKNFRSASDLKILGKWIKGKMEAEGVLTIGHPITEETLDKFGKHSLKLTKTNYENTWLLEMV